MIKVDQLAAANEAAIDQFSYFAKLSLANFEKFAELGLGAARDSVETATKHAQTLAAARDVHGDDRHQLRGRRAGAQEGLRLLAHRLRDRSPRPTTK